MEIKCDYCNKLFERQKKLINTNKRKGHNNYCSKKCQYAAMTKGTTVSCANCGKKIYRLKSQKQKSKHNNSFCNHSCAASFNNKFTKRGKLHPNYLDGTSNYINIAFSYYQPKCTICDFNIRSALQVHHIDKNRKNSSLDNLIIVCANCHSQIHFGNLKITDDIKNKRLLK